MNTIFLLFMLSIFPPYSFFFLPFMLILRQIYRDVKSPICPICPKCPKNPKKL